MGWAGERARLAERRGSLPGAWQQCTTLAWTAIWARCNPGGFLHEASATQVAGEVCKPLQLHSPCPCRRVGLRPIAAPDGPSPAAREGDSLGRPDLRRKKIPRSPPITNNHNRAWRPIERPAWCDGHFQGPDREIDAPGWSFRLVSWTFEKPLSATARPGSKVPLKKGPSNQVRPFSMRCRRAVAATSSAAARRGSLGLGWRVTRRTSC